MENVDCVVVGASFAGLACASALGRAGMRVTVLEKKTDPGEKLHTTGIIVKDAIDQITLLDGLPPALVRRINGVRLDAPNLRFLFDHFQSDAVFNLLLSTKLMRTAAGIVYFHHKGIFDPKPVCPIDRQAVASTNV